MSFITEIEDHYLYDPPQQVLSPTSLKCLLSVP